MGDTIVRDNVARGRKVLHEDEIFELKDGEKMRHPQDVIRSRLAVPIKDGHQNDPDGNWIKPIGVYESSRSIDYLIKHGLIVNDPARTRTDM